MNVLYSRVSSLPKALWASALKGGLESHFNLSPTL
jgi:hypothetical protein